MRTHFVVGGIFGVAAGVAHRGFRNARHFIEVILYAPETAGSEQGFLRFRALLGYLYVAPKGHVIAKIFFHCIDGRRLGLRVTPCVVFAPFFVFADVKILADTLPGTGIRCIALAQQLLIDAFGRKVPPLFDINQFFFGRFRHYFAIPHCFHTLFIH